MQLLACLLLLIALFQYELPVSTSDYNSVPYIAELVHSPKPDSLFIPKAGSPLSFVSSIRALDPELRNELYIWRDYSSAAYKDDLQEWSCPVCLKAPLSASKLPVVVQNVADTSRAVIVVNPVLREIIVAFRGTQNIQSLIMDFEASLIPWPKGDPEIKAHKGFASSLEDILPSVINTIEYYSKAMPEYQVTITGHSLGGAHAALLAYHLIRHDATMAARVRLFMYNPPRPGNKAMARLFLKLKVRAWRVVVEKDVVSTMPPLKSGFSHMGKEIWIKNGDTSLECDTSLLDTENRRCSMYWPRETTMATSKEHSEFWGVRM
ncbi:hypothetical protein IWQ60_010638 [Tieghemiomyces parasiticus]|uniref:Fungal lipase-type domain-containing protein n=1 Tax=Tieghemiomyces parasiticus TaxID=78921 RepID=A0A9W7ZKL4_9FUNG|nr:hypothetical protein IWQ60_010638 [Tieghemiomyces parasiticus]